MGDAATWRELARGWGALPSWLLSTKCSCSFRAPVGCFVVFGGMTTVQWPQGHPFLPGQQVPAILGKEGAQGRDFTSGAKKPLNLPYLSFNYYCICPGLKMTELRGAPWKSKAEGNNCSWSPTLRDKIFPYTSFSCPRAAPARPSLWSLGSECGNLCLFREQPQPSDPTLV